MHSVSRGVSGVSVRDRGFNLNAKPPFQSRLRLQYQYIAALPTPKLHSQLPNCTTFKTILYQIMPILHPLSFITSFSHAPVMSSAVSVAVQPIQHSLTPFDLSVIRISLTLNPLPVESVLCISLGVGVIASASVIVCSWLVRRP